MSVLFSDTSAEAERVLIDLLRKAPIERKLEMLDQMNRGARELATMGLRARHPRATAAELRRRLAGLLLGPDLAERAYGPLPREEHDAG